MSLGGRNDVRSGSDSGHKFPTPILPLLVTTPPQLDPLALVLTFKPMSPTVTFDGTAVYLSTKLLIGSYNYDFSHLSPIDRLPVELLTEIFILCTFTPNETPLIPLTLSSVCKAWREIVLNSPHVWQYISLDDKCPPTRNRLHTSVWADRARELPLDVHVKLNQVDDVLPALSHLFTYIQRWQRLSFSGIYNDTVDFASFSEDGSVAVHHHLSIKIRGPMEQDDEDMKRLVQLTSSKLYTDGPELCHRISTSTTLYTLPLPESLSTLNMRSLSIYEATLDVTPDPIRLVRFLACCPKLESFNYGGIPHEPSSIPETPIKLPIAHLHHLRTLEIRSTCAVRAILSHVHAPTLTELYLAHTNMEFELHHASSYTTESEDGDSEDEAHDFSQSPWSDHATGMGLRSLLRRSNPPLEILEMDYSDMRTKDFAWCFDHLEKLQEFRIVASDMSDKVIGMLAPYRQGTRAASINSDDEMEVDVEDTRPLRVRMPRLSALELWNCQRLSGDAVVDALGARVRHTDQVADGETHCRLSDIAVIQCADFQPRHAMRLSPLLGTRLRIAM